jgi:hypothetical protein
VKLSHAALRLATGAYILNSGVAKWQSEDDEYHKHIHEMATSAYPQLGSMEHRQFSRFLSVGEMALGAALLAPPVSPLLAGAGLSAFSGGLLGLYLRVPGLREPGSLRPSMQGLAIAKDSWMLAIGLTLMIDAISRANRRRIRRS